MKSLPLSKVLANSAFKTVGLVAADMDGTLTLEGKFTASLLKALEDLAAAGVAVAIVTGRSAGWVNGLVSYLPVVGAIAENGGLFYPGTGDPVLLTTVADVETHRQHLASTFKRLQSHFPQLRETSDNRFRITDWTFDIEGLTPEDLQQLNRLCEEMGWGFTYSSVQCHIKPQSQGKAIALLQLLRGYFPQYSAAQVLTVGDSPNDETLFDPDLFPLSVGVANIAEYGDRLTHHPAYITAKPEAEGFCELASLILQQQRQ